MTKDLPYQLQVPGLLQDGGRRVVAQGMRPNLPCEPRPHGQLVENVGGRDPAERPTLPRHEEIILRPGVASLRKPRSKEGSRLRPEEADAILPPLAPSNLQGPGSEVHVLDA